MLQTESGLLTTAYPMSGPLWKLPNDLFSPQTAGAKALWTISFRGEAIQGKTVSSRFARLTSKTSAAGQGTCQAVEVKPLRCVANKEPVKYQY